VTALLFVEVIDTAASLLDAILDAVLAWIVAAAFVVTVCLYTAILTGAWATRRAWRALTGPLVDEQAPQAPEPIPTPTKPTAPSWGRADKEAA
jgi:uncharacterized transporter YbjL